MTYRNYEITLLDRDVSPCNWRVRVGLEYFVGTLKWCKHLVDQWLKEKGAILQARAEKCKKCAEHHGSRWACPCCLCSMLGEAI